MKKQVISFALSNPNACGIDVGSRSHWVCIGPNPEDIREFQVFTSDLHQLARWLCANGVKTVVMESTGFYWKPLFLMLQSYGLEVFLVNAAHVKNVSGKKSDMSDCQWLWRLHSAGLLSASFQPDNFTEELRAYTRHRKSLIEDASRYINKMQKALVLMNIQLPVVLTDITGKSGQFIIQAILDGERDGKKLARLVDKRVKADQDTIVKALHGTWLPQYLFELRQCWQMYGFLHDQIAQCDHEIETLLQAQVELTGQNELVYPKPKGQKKKQKNSPAFDLASFAYQLSDGVDLMQIEGVGESTILTLMAETGLDLSRFPTAKHFVSWLALCPNNKISGGKVLSSKTKKNKGRLAQAFRAAANAAGRQKGTFLSDFFRRMAFLHGRKVAITATARKIAIIVYNMLVLNKPYCPIKPEEYQQKVRDQKIKNIQRTIRKLHIDPAELAFA